jgi:hypothetical protein
VGGFLEGIKKILNSLIDAQETAPRLSKCWTYFNRGPIWGPLPVALEAPPLWPTLSFFPL